MTFTTPLVACRFVSRPNRFVVVAQKENEKILAHCPNSGTLLTCYENGCNIYLSKVENPLRKYKYTWELSQVNNTLIFVNTLKTNLLVLEAIKDGKIKELARYETIVTEPRLQDNKRLDLLLVSGQEKCFVEIKNATLLKDNLVMFPDAVTKRGQEHLVRLIELKRQGYRAVIFFHVARTDGHAFSPAYHIDPVYSSLLYEAIKSGVEAISYRSNITTSEVKITDNVPIKL